MRHFQSTGLLYKNIRNYWTFLQKANKIYIWIKKKIQNTSKPYVLILWPDQKSLFNPTCKPIIWLYIHWGLSNPGVHLPTEPGLPAPVDLELQPFSRTHCEFTNTLSPHGGSRSSRLLTIWRFKECSELLVEMLKKHVYDSHFPNFPLNTYVIAVMKL